MRKDESHGGGNSPSAERAITAFTEGNPQTGTLRRSVPLPDLTSKQQVGKESVPNVHSSNRS